MMADQCFVGNSMTLPSIASIQRRLDRDRGILQEPHVGCSRLPQFMIHLLQPSGDQN